MTDENGAIVLPGAFIPAAESYGLIGEIDKVIAEKAMIKLKGVQSCLEDIAFAFNLSGKEIESLSHLEFIKEIINKTGVSAKSLIFEITETAAIQDLKKAITFIAELKKLGCAFSLDDFGVGFTSFSYLKELDVDYIKIDGAFIRKLDSNPQDQVIVRAMTGVAQGFKIQTIAEFVENDTILKMLGQLSVPYAQGYHIGKPVPQPVFDLPCQA